MRHLSTCLILCACLLIVFTYILTHLLTPHSTVLLQKLTGSQLVKKFPTFYGTRKFITAFTSARQLSLSWASSNQSIPPTSHFLKIHLNIILPSTLGSPSKCSKSTKVLWNLLFNLLEPEFYIYILAHPVGKMRIIQEPNKVPLWNKRHFEEIKTEIMQHV